MGWTDQDDLLTSSTPGVRRLQVDVGQTGFFAGREFRLFKEYTVGATPLVFRVTIPVSLIGVIVQALRLSCYQGGVTLRGYRMGTEGGVWTPELVFPNNAIPDVPGYVGQVTVESGGTFTPTGPVTDAITSFANETGKSSTTSTSLVSGERGIPNGVLYLVLSRVTGVSVDSLGEVSAVWEERPA